MKITEEKYFLSGVSYHMNKITGLIFFFGGGGGGCIINQKAYSLDILSLTIYDTQQI